MAMEKTCIICHALRLSISGPCENGHTIQEELAEAESLIDPNEEHYGLGGYEGGGN